MRTPWVRELAERVTGLKADPKVDPEMAVALGAALYAGAKSGEVSSFEMMDSIYNQQAHGRASGWQP